jgi:CheY-like chemotaxis protein
MINSQKPVRCSSRMIAALHDSIKVLIVEDDLSNNALFRLLLKNLGYSVEGARNGREALEKLEKTTYDIIFMDCRMPEMDGYQTTQFIRQHEQETNKKRTVIIGLTAYTTSGDREKCLAAGMDDFLSKPVLGRNLQQIINQWIRP